MREHAMEELGARVDTTGLGTARHRLQPAGLGAQRVVRRRCASPGHQRHHRANRRVDKKRCQPRLSTTKDGHYCGGGAIPGPGVPSLGYRLFGADADLGEQALRSR
jgi:hypothetical protein